MSIDLDFVAETFPSLLRAFGVTVEATLTAYPLAMVLGLVWALARRSPWPALSWPAAGAVEFLRSTPLLVQLYFLFYMLPDYGVQVSAYWTGVMALGLHFSAYTSEVYRSGIESVPQGQWDAAHALGLTDREIMWDIVLPQAIPPIVPALGNYLVAMFKETPLLSAITVVEVLQRAKLIGAEHFRYLEPMTIAGAMFLVVSLVAAAAIRAVERRLRIWR